MIMRKSIFNLAMLVGLFAGVAFFYLLFYGRLDQKQLLDLAAIVGIGAAALCAAAVGWWA
jgi:hypothetical protein